MGFLFVTALVSGVAIFLVASLLGWIVGKVAPKAMADLGNAPKTIAIVVVATAAYIFVMTRPSVVGPYEQWTFENIGGQVLGGFLVGGIKLWTGRSKGS